jgi:hypothetical protein
MMPSPIRNAARAACIAAGLAVVPIASSAQTEVRVMPYAGMTPVVAVQGGGQVEVTPRGGDVSYFAEYNRWAWGLICVGVPEGQEEDRCSETGYTVHAGVTRHLASRESRWRPYLSGGAGVARVLDEGLESRPVRLSLAAEGGWDFGGAGPFTVRFGARWQGRPQVGTDYVGPVVGFRLRVGQ